MTDYTGTTFDIPLAPYWHDKMGDTATVKAFTHPDHPDIIITGSVDHDKSLTLTHAKSGLGIVYAHDYDLEAMKRLARVAQQNFKWTLETDRIGAEFQERTGKKPRDFLRNEYHDIQRDLDRAANAA